MHIDQVRTFLQVVETGNFHEASRSLNVTQSTVSGRIRALEDRLGCALFLRTRTGVKLTPEGERLRPYALHLQRLWQRAEQEISASKAPRHFVALGTAPSISETVLLRWIPWMRQANPTIDLHVEASFSDSLMRRLARGTIDIGVMFEPEHVPGFIIEELFSEQLVLVTTDRSADVDWTANYVFVDWGAMFRTQHKGFFPDLSARVSSWIGPPALNYVLQAEGSGYFPLLMVRQHLAEGRLHRIVDAPVIRRPGYLVYESSAKSVALELGLRGLRSIARENWP
ncbi:LysR family transcriptional regulator [Taklimakanibacter lacteus]|uniref:LysR family transcriptional regulator n=1 Tax=Taklimakanibacter lacteus TaxID=2268456 RepID=UPI000E66649E